MSVAQYPRYDDSGIKWLGVLPAHWTASRLKRAVDVERPITYGIVQAGPHVPDGIPYVRPADMSDEDGVASPDEILRTSPEIAEGYCRSTIRTGDLVCSIGPSYGKVMVTPAWLDGANLTQGTARVAVAQPNAARYFFWFLRSRVAAAQWESSIGGATFRALNLGPLAETQLPLPPADEQVAIADFLDRETAKIDALVAEQERLIELLKEKRQAVISHAVTKGLNPDAPMKGSGVAWLGAIPMHWDVRTVSSLSTKITNGYVGPTRDILVDAGVRYLQSLHIKGNQIRFEVPYFVTPDWSAAHAKSVLAAGDVLIVQTGDIGQVAVVPEEFAGCNCHALIIVAPVRNVVSGGWLAAVLNSHYGYHSLLAIQTGALHPHLNCGNVKGIMVPVPPTSEQEEIVAAIRNASTEFDALIAEAERASLLLQERRAALISAAVTGQIDVRSTAESTAA